MEAAVSSANQTNLSARLDTTCKRENLFLIWVNWAFKHKEKSSKVITTVSSYNSDHMFPYSFGSPVQ